MMIGNKVLMVDPGEDSPIERGQCGHVVDLDLENFWHIEWDDGRRTFWPDRAGSEIAELAPEIPRCDFCSLQDVRWACHCGPVSLGVVGMVRDDRTVTIDSRSTDFWAACDACKRLIEAENWDGLVVRSAKRMRRQGRAPLRQLMALVAIPHEAFRSGFTGQITPEPEKRLETDGRP